MNLLDLILDMVLLYHGIKHLDSTSIRQGSNHKHYICDLHLGTQKKSDISNQNDVILKVCLHLYPASASRAQNIEFEGIIIRQYVYFLSDVTPDTSSNNCKNSVEDLLMCYSV